MKRYLATKQSYLFALGLALALAGWLISGQFKTARSEVDQLSLSETKRTEQLTTVRIQTFKAQAIEQRITISGRTEPARSVTLRAELDGRVVELGAARGSKVKQGDVIVRLDIRDRHAQLTEAKATLQQRKLQYRAAQRLYKQKQESETQLAQARTNLESARALLKRIEIEIANTAIRAPFEGILDRRPVEIGDYVTSGDEVAYLLEQDPMLIVGDVAQQEVHDLRVGMKGTAQLITGQHVEGRVRYIASESDEATRTFRVELEVPNQDHALLSGITSEIEIPVNTLTAHHLSPALLALNDAEAVGVKTVNEEGLVEFHPLQIIQSSAEGIWVAGLPETVQIITVGQGFVHTGQRVKAVVEETVASTWNRPEQIDG